jgi:oxygen-independent coproporphyrinogen-3 oxidase
MRIWLTRSFKPFLFLGEADEELRFRDVKKLGLYIHVPFCETICGFCPYCKCPYDREKADRYIDALLLETEMVAGRGEGRAEATSLYFGGGSPALAHGRMAEIIEAVRKRFRITEGIGVELHPREVNEEILSSLKRAGVSKISVGMQSFHEGCLSFLGRPSHDIPAMRAALEKTPFETVSIDLIFAMPGQTFETLKRDVDTAFAIGANHVALYPFIDFSFADKHAAPVAGREKKALLYRIVEYCESRGCHRTSIWTFSRDGGVYSSMTRDNFLGFGCSATSLLMDRFKINTFSVDEYIKRCESGRLPTSLTLRFTRRQRMVYYLFWTAYGTRIDPRGFETFFGVPLEKEYGFEMLLARAAGLIERKNGIYELTRRGVYYYHYFEQFYTLAYIDKMWGIMRETPFPERITL